MIIVKLYSEYLNNEINSFLSPSASAADIPVKNDQEKQRLFQGKLNS